MNTSERTIKNILEEYEVLRSSIIALFNGLSEKKVKHIGIANGNKTSVKALVYQILRHDWYHIKITESLYLKD